MMQALAAQMMHCSVPVAIACNKAVTTTVAAGMGIPILPASAVKHNVAAVVGCTIADPIALSEIGLALARDTGSAVVKNFRALALEMFAPQARP